MYQAVGAPGSRLTRVLWMLEELGEPYEIVKAKQHSETMRRYNPSGKMPALVDGDFVLTDSAAICTYLSKKHAEKGFGPEPGLRGEAEMEAWMQFAQSELEAPLWNKLRHKFILPETYRADVSAATAHDFANEVKALEAKLGGRTYALGDRFSAADVILGHCGQWARGGKFAVESDEVNAYFERVLGRPALARAREREKETAAA
ncbi:glutathione S-transferase family protein [Aquibium oceanicum]|uniref:Glutathione S-transferase n=1 Tax=Aquibium oceanicum TaxID=1670800 RepID=A0A1L3SNK9_9HYPH|nr:glutathione S-transferase family protein [Aquibium oceanicum]APH70960.1 glutathione S-transferase [Aquibium oceanicum]